MPEQPSLACIAALTSHVKITASSKTSDDRLLSSEWLTAHAWLLQDSPMQLFNRWPMTVTVEGTHQEAFYPSYVSFGGAQCYLQQA